MNTHPEQWAANAAAPGEQLGVWCLAQGSHLSRGIEGGESADYSLPPPTIPARPETRTRDLWVTSPTLYPLGHDCPTAKTQLFPTRIRYLKRQHIKLPTFFSNTHRPQVTAPLYSIFFETSIFQFNSSKCSPIMPDEVKEHLTRDQRPFLHPESLQTLQIHSSMLVLLLFSSPHSFSTGFRSED